MEAKTVVTRRAKAAPLTASEGVSLRNLGRHSTIIILEKLFSKTILSSIFLNSN